MHGDRAHHRDRFERRDPVGQPARPLSPSPHKGVAVACYRSVSWWFRIAALAYGSRAMRALRSFTVRASLPPALAPLQEIARNLRWSWDDRTRDLFRWLDPQQWEESTHDPVRMLGRVSRQRLEELAGDPAFMGFLDEIQGDLNRYLAAPRWFQNQPQGTLRAVAYFSPEFGIAEALPQYSGGLGGLAGD